MRLQCAWTTPTKSPRVVRRRRMETRSAQFSPLSQLNQVKQFHRGIRPILGWTVVRKDLKQPARKPLASQRPKEARIQDRGVLDGSRWWQSQACSPRLF